MRQFQHTIVSLALDTWLLVVSSGAQAFLHVHVSPRVSVLVWPRCPSCSLLALHTVCVTAIDPCRPFTCFAFTSALAGFLLSIFNMFLPYESSLCITSVFPRGRGGLIAGGQLFGYDT